MGFGEGKGCKVTLTEGRKRRTEVTGGVGVGKLVARSKRNLSLQGRRKHPQQKKGGSSNS